MRCAWGLKADHALDLAPERRLPTVHFELFGIELRGGQRRIRTGLVVGCGVFRTHLQLALALVGAISEAVDGEAQVRQNLVIDDIVEKNGIRVEGFLRQDDTVVECAVLANGYVPGLTESLL
jgi:hypothetical protein